MQEYVNDDTSTLIDQKNLSLPTGFEPVRAEPNGFRVHRLNHSATTAYVPTWECRTAKIKYPKNHQDQFESTKTDAFFTFSPPPIILIEPLRAKQLFTHPLPPSSRGRVVKAMD